MREAEIEFANLHAYGVAGADERAADAEQAYAAGKAAAAALSELAPGPQLAAALTKTAALTSRGR